MAVSIPIPDIMSYAKLGKAYFTFLDVLCNNHTETLIMKDSTTFSFLLMSLDAGLKSLDTAISTMCASAVDNLAGFYFKGINQEGGPSPAAKVSPLFISLTCIQAPKGCKLVEVLIGCAASAISHLLAFMSKNSATTILSSCTSCHVYSRCICGG